MNELTSLVRKNAPIDEIGRYLDWISHESRLMEIYAIPQNLQPNLFQLAKKGTTTNTLIPSYYQSFKPVIFYGINSLSAFRKFQKILCRTEDQETLIGYNHQPMMWLTGPGYFEVNNKSERQGEVLFDYTKDIPKKPVSWPKYKSSHCGISRFVYGGLKDYMRQVSDHVFIGEAVKKEKHVGYFILCREEFMKGES